MITRRTSSPVEQVLTRTAAMLRNNAPKADLADHIISAAAAQAAGQAEADVLAVAAITCLAGRLRTPESPLERLTAWAARSDVNEVLIWVENAATEVAWLVQSGVQEGNLAELLDEARGELEMFRALEVYPEYAISQKRPREDATPATGDEVASALAGGRATWCRTVGRSPWVQLPPRVLPAHGRPDAPASPLAQAAKRRRDLPGEIDALMSGQQALESAPWYPARAGDILHVHYAEFGDVPDAGETYVVEHSEAEGGLVLRELQRSPDMPAGSFAPGMVGNPFMDPWIEAGPATLTIVRYGRVVHGGSR